MLPKPYNFHSQNPVVGKHPTTREIIDLLRPRSTPTEIGLFLHEQFTHLHTRNTQT